MCQKDIAPFATKQWARSQGAEQSTLDAAAVGAVLQLTCVARSTDVRAAAKRPFGHSR